MNLLNTFINPYLRTFFALALLLVAVSCEEDDDDIVSELPDAENSVTYQLPQANESGVNGYIVFSELSGGTIQADIFMAGTESGNSHPAHIHANSIVEGGDITIPLNPVEGSDGRSTTQFSDISFDELLNYDGHVNVHLSESDLTVVAQNNIGGNELTGTSVSYNLEERAVEGISGSVVFAQRKNGSIRATISLVGTPDGGQHPAHIHQNSAAQGGPIAISFTPVSGTTGMSVTDIDAFDDGTPITFTDLLDYDGYVNVHLSADQLGTIVAQGDIGINELNGNSIVYDLDERAIDGISGTASFFERNSGEILAVLALEGTPEGGVHPAHIHRNAAVEGGGIAVSFNPVNGTTGISRTDISAFDDGTPLTYDELLDYDGYVNVHLAPDMLGTIVAQGDIGGNELTGEFVNYPLDERAVAGISGSATLFQRKNGNTLAVIELEGTPEGGAHPAHIHRNTAAEGGGIRITLDNVDGTTGLSETNIRQFNDGTAVTYSDLLEYDGYINVHLSSADLGTIVAQGDIGQNALTGASVVYDLGAVNDSGVMGSATFFERLNGTTLVVLDLEGTPEGGDHPAHIHFNSAEESGPIAISLTNVNGDTGMSRTQVEETDNNIGITYAELLEFDGYINVHLSPDNLGTIVAQGNIGSNVTAE
jgi:hypothetical protein